MGDVLRDMSLAALTQAVEANLTAFHVALSDWPEITLHRDNDRIWTVSQRRFSLCNVVLEARSLPLTWTRRSKEHWLPTWPRTSM